MITTELLITTIGTVFAFAIFSYAFFGDHLLYGIAEMIFLGGITAQAFIQIANSFRTQAFDLIAAGRVLLVVPIFLGALTFARLTRYRWAARYPVAVFAGIGLGLSFGLEIQTSVLGIVTQTIGDLQRGVNWAGFPDKISSVVIAIVVFFSMAYFMYSARIAGVFHSQTSKLHWVSRVGRIFLMVGFAYRYGLIGEWSTIVTFVTVVIRRFVYNWIEALTLA